MPLQSSSPEGQKEQALAAREVKKFPITVDGEVKHYPENYPFQFIANGPIKIIGAASLGNVDRVALNRAIDTFTQPVKELFAHPEKQPDWYTQTLEPLLAKNHLSLQQLRPDDLDVLGPDYWGVMETLWNHPFTEQLREQAARSMGQIEGKVPTLSVLIEQLKHHDTQTLESLLAELLKKGPDGLTLAAFLAKEGEHQQEQSKSLPPLDSSV